jgi:hypothetical protein
MAAGVRATMALRLPLLAVLLCLAGHASAQAVPTPFDPAVTLSLTGPLQAVGAKLGTQQDIALQVKLDVQNAACPSPTEVTVTLRVEDAQPVAGVTAAVPASVKIELPATFGPGGPGPDGLAHAQGSESVSLHLAVAKAVANGSASFRVVAEAPAGLPPGCQAPSPNPTAAQTKTLEVGVAIDVDAALNGTGAAAAATCPAASGATPTTPTTSTTAACAHLDPRPAFFLPLQVQVGVLLAMGLAGRRRL